MLTLRPAGLLTALQKIGSDSWVIFSDDDDIWHPLRCAHYIRALVETTAAAAGQVAFGIARDVRPLDAEADPASAQDVDGLLRSGRAGLTGSSQSLRGGSRLEYFHYCVHASVFCAFMRSAQGAVLASPYCDLAFAEFVRSAVMLTGAPSAYEPPEADWMYYYDRVTGSKATGEGGPPTEDDRRCSALLGAQLEHLHIPSHMDVLRFLAKLRTNVEMLVLEEYPMSSEAHVVDVLLPMILDRRPPSVASIKAILQPPPPEERAKFLATQPQEELTAATQLIRFYMERCQRDFGLTGAGPGRFGAVAATEALRAFAASSTVKSLV